MSILDAVRATRKRAAWEGLISERDVEGVPRYRSLREAYVDTTGDAEVTGRIGANVLRDLAATIASAMSNVVASRYENDLEIYRDNGAGWLYRQVEVLDFRPVKRMSTVSHAIPLRLPLVSPTEPYCATTSVRYEYEAQKRGAITQISINDVRGGTGVPLSNIARQFAYAAARTHYEFIHDLYRHDTALMDGRPLYERGVNLLPCRFNVWSWLALRRHCETAGLPAPRHIMVPFALEQRARRMATALGDEGPGVHVIANESREDVWFACAGADVADQIEIGYLDGQQLPVVVPVLAADCGDGTVDEDLFSEIGLKLRHIYGGAVANRIGFIACAPSGLGQKA